MEISWTEVLKIVAGVIAALGGGGAIVAGLSSWLGKVWADRLMAKETAKFREDLERLTKQLERKNYVSKVRFDAEFAIYQELSKVFFDVVVAQNDLFTYYQFDVSLPDKTAQQELCKQRYETARLAYNSAIASLHKNSPFIDKDFFDRFNDILRDIKLQLFHYPSFYVAEDAAETKRECKKLFDECSKRTNEIKDRMKNLCADLREYLKTLDVVDKK